ncbi:MAG: hypothetical protein FWD69_08430 [Polyangiaceae bacterium]|nr:hypothetical protein [Polyangiaceae bacterium]
MDEEVTMSGTAAKSKNKAASKPVLGAQKSEFEGSKTDFIRKFPNLRPVQIEAKAKEAGLAISASYVSSVRSKTKVKKAAPAAKAVQESVARPPAAAVPAAAVVRPAPAVRPAPTRTAAEAEFRRAARTITLDRAQEILNGIAAAYEG